MKYSVSEAAKRVGVTRRTLYTHIGEKKITTEKDDKGNTVIDAAELVRIYGDKVKFDVKDIKKLSPGKHDDSAGEDASQIALLKKEIAHLKEKLEIVEKHYQERIEGLENDKQHEKERFNRLTALLPDQRKERKNEQEEISNKFKMLEERLNQQDIEKKKLQQQNKRLKNALTQEKQRSLWDRVFTSKQDRVGTPENAKAKTV